MFELEKQRAAVDGEAYRVPEGNDCGELSQNARGNRLKRTCMASWQSGNNAFYGQQMPYHMSKRAKRAPTGPLLSNPIGTASTISNVGISYLGE